SAAVRILFDLRDHLVDLVDRPLVFGAPGAPLGSINSTEIAVRVRPFIPNRHAVLVEVLNICVAAEKPEQFVDDRLEVQFLGGNKRESILKRETRLGAKNGVGPGAGPV